MRWESTEPFKADYKKLTTKERQLFLDAVRRFNEAADLHLERRSSWPKALRVKAIASATGVFEMTWSFAGPDGRATWEWTRVEVDGEPLPAIRWRRIGGHEIFREP